MIYLNGTPLNVTMFPDRTSQVWKLPPELLKQSIFNIKWDYANEGEIMHLAQLGHLLYTHGHFASLRMTYLPYGRQDKEVSNDTTFALQTFASMLNTMMFTEVVIHDPHSEKALEWIHRSRAIYPTDEVEKVLLLTKTDMLCYPDKGAVTKYKPIYEKLGYMNPIVYGEKVRDQLTGNILKYDIVGDSSGHNVLIIDDLCDGGMTFKLLAKDLLAQGAKEVNLFVTHGLFTKGLKTLKDSGINRIFTQDGEASEMQNNITYRRL